jgi:hypothetical protein
MNAKTQLQAEIAKHWKAAAGWPIESLKTLGYPGREALMQINDEIVAYLAATEEDFDEADFAAWCATDNRGNTARVLQPSRS